MRERLKAWIRRPAPRFGLFFGLAYGLLLRMAIQFEVFGEFFGVMSIAFLVLVPLAIGVLSVVDVDRPSILYRLFAPWLPMLITVAATVVFGWEGSICVALALPLLLPFASLGGLLGAIGGSRRQELRRGLIALPLLVAPLEQALPSPDRLVVAESVIEIAAPPEIVWPLVVSVDSIRPEEQRPALFLALGFPRPISANLSEPGVGGVRSARFTGALTFTETVTEWMPGRRLSFSIEPNTAELPPTTLDPHVTIGGPFFDVLTGTYELQPVAGGTRTRLLLRSTHRVSTHFNLYAGWWVDRIMASIQQSILDVHRVRAERIARSVVT